MKNHTKSAALVAVLALVSACEQAEQPLPLSSTQLEVVRVVPAEGAVLSSSSGASVHLAAGAVPAGTRVSLTPVQTPRLVASGTVISLKGFVLEPAGMELKEPSISELKLERTSGDAWLSSLVVETRDGLSEVADATLDLSNGLLRAEIGALGTVMAVVPEADAVVRAGRITGTSPSAEIHASAEANVASTPTRALRGSCGAAGQRCRDLRIQVSDNLLSISDTIAAVFPRIAGEIRIDGASATGSLRLQAPLRFRLSRGSVVTIRSEALLEPTSATRVAETAGRLTLSNVRVRATAGGETHDETVSLSVVYQGDRAFVEVDQAFLADIGAKKNQFGRVVAQLPLVRVQ